MSRRLGMVILVLILVGLVAAESAFAEVKFKWGPYLRARHEFWKNWKDMNNDSLDNRNFFRFKTSLWGQWDFDKDLSLYLKLTDEFKAYTYFAGSTSSVPDKSANKKGYRFDINEVVFDNFYADIRNFAGAPVDLRIGRQDFLGIYGEGFLIMDGTPQDGSRTFYFDAAKASWKVNDKNTVDVIYINNTRDEEFYPVINRRKLIQYSNRSLDKAPSNLNTTDENGYVLYARNKSIKNLSLDGYYIFKYEAEEGGLGYQAQKGKLNTMGTFAKYELAPWTFRGQIASQFGEYGDNDREGLGGYAMVDHNFKDLAWSPKASVGYLYLSGDDKGSTENEGWNPLFSRYPWISELYVLSMASETSIPGYWTNVNGWKAELVVKPTQKSKLSLWYYYLRANELPTAGTVISGTGKIRGHLPQVRLDYTINKNVNAYFLAEYLIPGNFYKQKSEGLFLRTELQIKF